MSAIIAAQQPALYAHKMEYVLKFSELEKYFEKADFTDVKVFEGETTLRKFIASINRFYVITTVFYKHWTGPVYFNYIRPFHHLVVSQMAKYGLKH